MLSVITSTHLKPKVFPQAPAWKQTPLSLILDSTVPDPLQGHLQSTMSITSVPHGQDTPMQTILIASSSYAGLCTS